MTEQTQGILNELSEERKRQAEPPFNYDVAHDNALSLDDWDMKTFEWLSKAIKARATMSTLRREGIRERRKYILELAAILVAQLEAFDRKYDRQP